MTRALPAAVLAIMLASPAAGWAVSITFIDPVTKAPITTVPAGFSGPLSLSMNIMGTDTTPEVLAEFGGSPPCCGYQFSMSAGAGVQIDALEGGAPFGQPFDAATSTGESWTSQDLSPDGVNNFFPSATFTFVDVPGLEIVQAAATCLSPVVGTTTADVAACGDIFLEYGTVTISVATGALPGDPVLTFLGPRPGPVPFGGSLVLGRDASGQAIQSRLGDIVMLRVAPEPTIFMLLVFGLATLTLARGWKV